MGIRRMAGLGRRGLWLVALALCVCVFMQMLGAPVTLLTAGDSPDEFSGSVLEGFAVPPAPTPLTLLQHSLPAVERPLSVYLLVLTLEQFHPPAV